jgi:hypothetical protein
VYAWLYSGSSMGALPSSRSSWYSTLDQHSPTTAGRGPTYLEETMHSQYPLRYGSAAQSDSERRVKPGGRGPSGDTVLLGP